MSVTSVIRRRKAPKEQIDDERLIVRGLITNQPYADRIAEIIDTNIIASDYNRIIIGWCLEYHKEFHNVPGAAHIQDVFADKTRGMDPEEVENIEVALAFISELADNDEFHEEYAIKRAVDYINSRQAAILESDLKAAKRKGVQSQLELIDKFSPVEIAPSHGVNPFIQPEVVQRAFANTSEPLFTFPGRFGELVNDQFTRASLVAFLGREKIGKTQILTEIVFRALRNRRRVAFFQCGDMSEAQITRRMAIRIAKVSDMEKYLGALLIPVIDCEWNQLCECEDAPPENSEPVMEMVLDDEGRPTNKKSFAYYYDHQDHVPCDRCFRYRAEEDTPEDQQIERETRRRFKGSSWFKERPALSHHAKLDDMQAYNIMNRWYERHHNPAFRLSTHGSDQLTIKNVRSILQRWKREDGFEPEVCVFDYFDIMKQEGDHNDYRHGTNGIWSGARSLSVELDCCVVGATQADAASYTAFLLKLNNFSEDKRKYAHVTAFYGLNQTDEEKKRKIIRVNPLMLRESDFESDSYVTILQSPAQGQAYLDSF